MKKLSAIAMALALLLMSSPAAYPQAKQTTTTPPPVASTLVREGDFATRLVSAFEIGMAENETEAETMLASAGIAPKNGWISDYPVTPDILGELQDAVAAAADSNRLPMGNDEALEVLDNVSADLGLYVLSYTSGEYAETLPPASPQYTEPTVINNYYYKEGPPVVTYYPPPPDYLYLYAWVPYPFWYARFSFSGFFILHDFHKVSIIHQRAVVVTNKVFHRQHRRFYKIDPVKRRGGRSFWALARRTYGRPLFTAEARRGARSILQRSHDRMASQRRMEKRNVAILKSPKVFKGRTRTEIAPQTRSRSGLAGIRAKTFPRQEVQRAHRDPARFFRAPGISEERSSSLPSMGERGFSGGLRKGSKRFSGKVSRKIPGGSALKGALKLPF
ncbi:MAG: hypothetical protein OES18_25860 [Deltaproteobacteria bacterium]|nr:hypothetical protein [Deltaproteobacteria bacterium]